MDSLSNMTRTETEYNYTCYGTLTCIGFAEHTFHKGNGQNASKWKVNLTALYKE
jgi:hypothetical protein